MKRTASLLAALALAGCGTAERLGRIGRGPALAPAAAPVAPGWPPTLADPAPSSPVASASSSGSLFVDSQASLFRDLRARRPGDVLTVRVEIADRAALGNATTRSRTGSEAGGFGALFGLESLARRILGSDPARLVEGSTTSENGGQGQVARSETVTLTLAATVVSTLPNGNLVIRARQQTRVNQELRELVVEGIVRPQDVARDNSIRHTQIADARISYGGRGLIQDAQQPRWGQQLIDAISPF